MRFRPLASLSLAAAAVVLLAGCSASAPADEPSESAAGDLCAAAAAPGAASDAVMVEGDFGAEAAATFTAPLEVGGVERTVVAEGDGAQLAVGDFVSYGLTAYDAASGELIGSAGYGDTPLQPQQLAVEGGLDQLLGCATVGSRLVATLPGTQGGGAQIYVLDVLGADQEDTWCAPVDFSGEAPTVVFGDDGRPTVTIPAGDLPAETSLKVLEEGDGDVVQPGAEVEVNYEGVKWSDGSVFDSSYERGESTSFPTDGVVAGFRVALEGQKVGSTVLVAMPPVCGYGDQQGHELQNETLVFVVNIIGIVE